MSFPKDGTYGARLRAKMVIEETAKGAIAVVIPYALCGLETSFNGVQRLYIVKKDGAIIGRNIDALKKVFNWDGLNFFDLEEIEVPESESAQFELQDMHPEEYTPEATEDNPDPKAQTRFVASWFNALGGGMQPLDDDARERLVKKFASKLRALSGSSGKKAKEEEPEEPEEQPPRRSKPEPEEEDDAPARPPKSTGATARTSTQQEVWLALEKRIKPKDAKARKQLSDKVLWKVVEKQFDDKDPLLPADWGQVADKLESMDVDKIHEMMEAE